MSINPIGIVKFVASNTAAIGAGIVATNAIKMTTPDNMSKVKTVFAAIGSFALSGAVGDVAARYTENLIDENVATFKKARVMAKKTKDDVVEGETVENIEKSDN